MYLAQISGARKVVRDIAVVGLGIAIFWFALLLVFGTANPFYVVSSGSMVPELHTHDILIVQANDPFESVQLGDIIVFNRPSGTDRVIVHRVVSVIDDSPYTLRTKGDANSASIQGTDFPITEEEYLGTVIYVVPQLGLVTQILAPPVNYILIAIIVGVLIFKQFKRRGPQPDSGRPATGDVDGDTAYTAGGSNTGDLQDPAVGEAPNTGDPPRRAGGEPDG